MKKKWLWIALVVLVGGSYYGYRNYRNQQTFDPNGTFMSGTIDEDFEEDETISMPQSTTDLRKIDEFLQQNPTTVTWKDSVVTANSMASDLIQVCVDENNGSMDICDWFEYWTNNRSGKWELIGRYSAGVEGLSSCEDWEKLQVARGMECMRWGERGWSESIVDY